MENKAKMIDNPDDGNKEAEYEGTMTIEEQTRHEVLSQWIVAAKMAKQPVEWEWFVRKNFVDGNHWIKFNTETNSIEQVGAGDKYRVTINKIGQVVRAIRNYTTKHQPKWEVMAQDLDKKVYNKSIASGKFLDLFYLEDLSSGKTFKRKVKEIVGDAIWASIGNMWFYWDTDKKWLISDPVDPFDWLPDPTTTDVIAYTDAMFVFRAKKQKVNEITSNKAYKHTEDVIADGKLADSDMKVTLLALTSGLDLNAFGDTKDLETAITYEGYIKRSEKNSKGGMVDHVILTATAMLVDEETKFDEIPCRSYHTDVENGRQYTQGWVKNLIPAQKLLNAGESQTAEFNHVIAKGRYITDKGSGVNVVVNKNGQIIEKNKGTFFQQLQMQPQVSTVDNQIARSANYIEDLASAHDAFLGRMPSAATSGQAIETLLLGEENNLVDLRDNLDDFLISCGKMILRAYAKYQMGVLVFFSQDPTKKAQDVYAMTGKSSPVKIEKQNINFEGKALEVPINRFVEDNNIRISIGTWMGSGKIDQRKELLQLYQAKLIDQGTVLQYYNAPNIPEIIEQTNKEKATEAALQAATAAPMGTMPALDPTQLGVNTGVVSGSGGVSNGTIGTSPSPVPTGTV